MEDYTYVLHHHRYMIKTLRKHTPEEARLLEDEVNKILEDGVDIKDKLFEIIDCKLKEPEIEIDFSKWKPSAIDKLREALTI